MSNFFINIYLNQTPYDNDAPNVQDTIKIAVNPCHASPDSVEFLISYKHTHTYTLSLYTKDALCNYLEGVFHLLKNDRQPFHSVDLIMTAYPSVKFFMADLDNVLPTIRQAIHLFV